MKKASVGRPLPMLVCSAIVATTSACNADNRADDLDRLVDRRTPLVIDFMDGAYLPAAEGIVVTGPHGLLGVLKITDEGAELRRYDDIPLDDFTALERISDSEILLGNSRGHVLLFDGKEIKDLGKM